VFLSPPPGLSRGSDGLAHLRGRLGNPTLHWDKPSGGGRLRVVSRGSSPNPRFHRGKPGGDEPGYW
ncbi:MAG: hypothetical protein ABFD16_11155, partial [Thermoguttaceae bacterium]